MIVTCDKCVKFKEVCCAFRGDKSGKTNYTYCKSCCPWKSQHAVDKARNIPTVYRSQPSLDERVSRLEEEVRKLKLKELK